MNWFLIFHVLPTQICDEGMTSRWKTLQREVGTLVINVWYHDENITSSTSFLSISSWTFFFLPSKKVVQILNSIKLPPFCDVRKIIPVVHNNLNHPTFCISIFLFTWQALISGGRVLPCGIFHVCEGTAFSQGKWKGMGFHYAMGPKYNKYVNTNITFILCFTYLVEWTKLVHWFLNVTTRLW